MTANQFESVFCTHSCGDTLTTLANPGGVGSSGAAAASSNGGHQAQQSAAQNNQTTSGGNRLAGSSHQQHQQAGGSGTSNGAAGNAADWNPEECDRFSFDDSDRFEEDSLCSWSSEPESVCNNWRGWKRPSNNTGIGNWVSQKKQQDSDQVISLTELAAKCVASYIPFELVEHVYPPVPEQLQLRIAFWSFPDNEEDIRLYSCLANSSADEFHRGDQLFRNRAVKDPLQIGFHLSASVISQQPRDQFNVAVTFDRRRISSCNCTCTSSAYWCSHVVAVCLHRIHCPNEVCLRAPVSESLTRLQRDQLQKFAQYLISELPQQILPTAQRLLDELLSSQPTAINTVCGAPDPTAGASANDQTSWYLDEKTLHENIKRILIKFCLPAPIVFSDVNYLTNSAPPAAAEWSSLLRPLRGREPEGMWNLLSIVREMYRRCDRNAVRLLEIITEECMACDQILIWWFYTKLSLLVGTNGHGGGKHSNTHSNSNASQHACASLCDEIVVLWRLAALNPGLAPDERDMLHAQFTAWHLKILDRVVKCGRMQPPSYSNKHQQNSRSDAELFIGFKPAIEACYLDWEDYPIAGITHTQETNPIYYSPFTCFKHSDTKSEFPNSSQINSTQATLMATQNKHYNYISTDNQQSHHHHSVMKSRYERPLYGRGDRSYVSSSNNSSNSSSDSMNILIKSSTHHHTGNVVASSINISTNGGALGLALSGSSNVNKGNGGSLPVKNSIMNDGNRSSASSEGFCENEDFGGDSSGNNIDTIEGGRTIQPSCLLTSKQVITSAGEKSKISSTSNVLKSLESESDSQASIEISSSSSCNGTTSIVKNSIQVDKDLSRENNQDKFDFATTSTSGSNFMKNVTVSENKGDAHLAVASSLSKNMEKVCDKARAAAVTTGKSIVTVTEVNKLLNNQIRQNVEGNEGVLTSSQMSSSSSSSSSSASSVSGSISSNALTADTSGGNEKHLKISSKDHRRQSAKDEFLSSSSDEFTANDNIRTSATIENVSHNNKTANDTSIVKSSLSAPLAQPQECSNSIAIVSGPSCSSNIAAASEYKHIPTKAPIVATITASLPPTTLPTTSTVPQYINNLHYSQYVYHRQPGNSKQQIFSNLRPTEDAWDILLARAEGLHAHGHGREACILAVRLAEEMLAHPPNLMIELPMPPRRKGKKQNINPISHQLSVLASTTLSKCVFLCTVLAENSEHYHLAFRICLFALEMPRPPASTKPLEVKLANQEADLLGLLKKIPLNQPELRVIRERAEQLRNGTLKSRGEALLPINLASFIFDALVMPSVAGKENRNKVMSLSYRIPTDENLGFEAAVAALGLKANVSEAEHPLLCEGTRRQRGDLALTLLYYYKDEPRKIAKIMEKLLDREIHILLKQPLLPAYYSNNPPVRTPASQTRREHEHETIYASNPEVYSSDYAAANLSGNGGGNSRPHSSTSAELEIGMNQLNISSPQTSISCPIGSNGTGQLQTTTTVTGATSRTKDIRYKGKRAYPSIPNQPSEASAHFMFELSKNVLTKAGGTSSTSLFTQATTNQNHHGPHRGLHMCAFQLGLYALGLHNCVSPNWLSRTYSSHVSWIIGQAMEIGAPAISFLIDTWEGHLTPPEAASMADRASKGWDNNMVYPAAELALSVLPHAAALNPNEIQRAISQCKEQSDQMLERACITVETAAKGGGVYPEVLFQVAHYWYELYLRNTPNSEREEHDINDVDHSVSLSALIESQAEQAQQQQQQVQQSGPPQAGMPPSQQVVVTTAPPPFQQGVTTIAPIGIGPYGAPYSFCQGIYHHHNISYPGNQMQMYISAGPPQPYQYAPQPPQQTASQPPNVAQVPPYPPPGSFAPMQHPPPPQSYGQPIPCQANGPVVGAPQPGQPGAYGQIPSQMQVNTSSVPPPQMQQSMQYYGQSMALLPPPPQVMVPQSQAQQNSQQSNSGQSSSVRGQPNHHGLIYPMVQQPSMQRQRHPHQFTQTQLRYLLAAYNVGMLAMETLARRVHDDRPQAKYARNPPYGEDVKWLLRISKKLGTQYLHQFCICAVNSIVSPFVLHDVAIESAHYLGRNNPTLVMQHLRSALTPLVQKCQQMYIQCIHQKLYHLTQADYEEFASIILAARAAFQITPEGNAQFKDWLQSIKRSKSCKKDLWAQINTALQSNSK
ncbi:zinc finger SWIM domain-containing protein 8 homolog [Condylostylus longicornis]|uniref:zinc finger SWIM domain-containing protein 8 homolog n=1 Tax=Condylostylus longicornis TaxID=2530218 RepID=UPI00244E503D|nr:zinc finger SWIM domain-containing protein 8 homolog [Condylostylus longicornis]